MVKVKVKDIAKAAGVSSTAVSQVLNDKPCRLSEATKEKILRVAREMKFQSEGKINPDALGKIKTIGLVIPDTGNLFFRELSEEISRCFFREGYTVLQCNVGDDLGCCYQALESLTCKNVDGMIVIPPCTSRKDVKLQKMLKSLQNSGVPMILADRAVYSVFCDFVTADNKYGGKAATMHLIEKGHKRIGCIMGNEDVYTARKRIDGYKQALVLNGISFKKELVFFGDFKKETGFLGAGELLKQGVTAIFAGNDEIARGIYRYAKENSINIPEDLSVVGFDNTEICEFLDPPLTSVEQNSLQIAEKIVEVMLRNLDKLEEEEGTNNYYYTPLLKERLSVSQRV